MEAHGLATQKISVLGGASLALFLGELWMHHGVVLRRVSDASLPQTVLSR
jgi:hypothetical protein